MTTEAAEAQRTLRVTVDLQVDQDAWDERMQEGSTDKFLVGEVKKTLRIDGGPLCRDIEIQDIQFLEEGGNPCQ
jgi:hypothetical protein